jgi:hypothetical protein
VNFFALSLNNPASVISFARNQNPSKQDAFASSYTVLQVQNTYTASPTGIIYINSGFTFSRISRTLCTQIRKNGNNIWEEAIKTEFKQFTNNEKFLVLDSG